MSSNQFLIDAASRHAVLVQRHSAQLEDEMADSVEKALNGVVGGISSGQPQEQVLADYRNALSSAEQDLLDDVVALTEAEAEFSEEMFKEAIEADIEPAPVAVLSTAVINRSIDAQPGQKVSMQVLLSTFSDKKAQQVRLILNDSFSLGETVEQTSTKIREITGLQRRQAQTVARTGANIASTVAREEMIKANEELLEGYEWVSTLDARTSNICMARDGVIYPISDRSPKPPAHYGCRSTIIPKVSPKYDKFSDISGDRPSKGAEGVEIVSSNTTYGGWLRKQPASFQDEVLGAQRAKLFRGGKLTLDKFVDPEGRRYTLQELKLLNPLAFES